VAGALARKRLPPELGFPGSANTVAAVSAGLSRLLAVLCLGALCASATACGSEQARVLTISGSMLGREGEVLRAQLERFRAAHPGVPVELRATPDAADLRHQLYVQWLNAHVSEPDVLQLDVVWTPEFAAAGWISPLDPFQPPVSAFFPASVDAHRWSGAVYALPWFIDVGMLYWRTDLVAAAPRDLDELMRMAGSALTSARAGVEAGPRPGSGDQLAFGYVWQGARYEGLVVNFLEHLGAFGGAILDEDGRVRVDEPAAVEALTFMRDAIRDRVVPDAVLTWQEEQARFAFQSGQAVFMRNWPYAFALLSGDPTSAVAGRFAVAPVPAGPGGMRVAALGGSALAINAHTDQPAAAYALIDYLLQPEQMMQRARVVGQFPPRRALYDDPGLSEALGMSAGDARRIIEAATPRPVTPVYSQLSAILQVALHAALTGQEEPRPALQRAATEIRALLAQVRLAPSS
jgi:multiple sugar transport system substrate-binding protein